MLTQQSTILQFDTSVLDHISAATIHHCQKCKQGMLLHHWKYILTNITHVACWSPFSTHTIRYAQTFLIPTCFSTTLNMLTVDIPTSAAIAVHVMLLSSSGTAPTRSTSLICHGCQRTTACSISYIFPPPTNGVHPSANSSISCNMIAQPFMHQIMTPSWCFPKQEMKSSYMRKFLAVILSPLFSCKWRNKQKLHLTIAKHQHCCHTVNFWNNKVIPTRSDNTQVVCVIEQVCSWCFEVTFSTLWTTRNFAFQLVLKCCILMVHFASSHNVNTKINQWPNLIRSKSKSKNLHKASHQHAAEQFHISDNFIYLQFSLYSGHSRQQNESQDCEFRNTNIIAYFSTIYGTL